MALAMRTRLEPSADSILHLRKPLPEIATELGMEEAALRERIEDARRRLFEARKRRVHPHKDDKILTDWNGLMIAALAKGARALNEPLYAQAAAQAAHLILSHLQDEHGRLLKRYRDGQAGLPAVLDDYAFLVWGLLELYEATFELQHLRDALRLTDLMLAHFWDEQDAGCIWPRTMAMPCR